MAGMPPSAPSPPPVGSRFLPGYTSSEEYSHELLGTLVAATRAANALPRGTDYGFHFTTRSFRARISALQSRILSTAAPIVTFAAQGAGAATVPESHAWRDKELDDEDRMDAITEVCDAVLEQVDAAFDMARGTDALAAAMIAGASQPGIVSAPAKTAGGGAPTTTAAAAAAAAAAGGGGGGVAAWNASLAAAATTTKGRVGGGSGGGGSGLMHAKNIRRPQLDFVDKPDNSHEPFVPRLPVKPHSLTPLNLTVQKEADGVGSSSCLEQSTTAAVGTTVVASEAVAAAASGVSSPNVSREAGSSADDQSCYVPHPYRAELNAFSVPPAQLENRGDPQPFAPVDALVPPIWIDTPAALEALVSQLSDCSEVAVDLEAHSYRSYQGFCCLMQVSTRTQDYLVDALRLRSQLHTLNVVFANPSIVKVLHGADSDVLWLQRDFGLYLVNLFDTGQAMRVLDYPRYSLAFLLQHYCGVTLDKQYQLADWRIRPLTPEMLHYAREDTHNLLHVYDRLTNDLLARGNAHQNLLRAVYDRSRDVCSQRYEKPRATRAQATSILARHRARLTDRQMAAFNALLLWRDEVARREDESWQYTLPNRMMLELARRLPSDGARVISCCQPTPPLVRLHTRAIVDAIATADAASMNDVSGSVAVAVGGGGGGGVGGASLAMVTAIDGVGSKRRVTDAAAAMGAERATASAVAARGASVSSSLATNFDTGLRLDSGDLERFGPVVLDEEEGVSYNSETWVAQPNSASAFGRGFSAVALGESSSSSSGPSIAALTSERNWTGAAAVTASFPASYAASELMRLVARAVEATSIETEVAPDLTLSEKKGSAVGKITSAPVPGSISDAPLPRMAPGPGPEFGAEAVVVTKSPALPTAPSAVYTLSSLFSQKDGGGGAGSKRKTDDTAAAGSSGVRVSSKRVALTETSSKQQKTRGGDSGGGGGGTTTTGHTAGIASAAGTIAVEPFDYAAAGPSLLLTADGKHGKGGKRRGNKGAKGQKGREFKPYAADDSHHKAPRRNKVKNNRGNKTITFRKSKQ